MCEQQLNAEDHVKVKLVYVSASPHTEAALTLERLSVRGPWSEELYVLMPRHKAFSDLDAYLDAFEYLRAHNAVPKDAKLTEYSFDEETDVLAYVIPG